MEIRNEMSTYFTDEQKLYSHKLKKKQFLKTNQNILIVKISHPENFNHKYLVKTLCGYSYVSY